MASGMDQAFSQVAFVFVVATIDNVVVVVVVDNKVFVVDNEVVVIVIVAEPEL